MQLCRRALPSLFRRGGSLGTAAPAGGREFAAAAPQQPSAAKPEEDDDIYQLLPPGCSMLDPTHGRSFEGNSLSDPVENYNARPVEEYRPLKKRQPVPAPPLNVAAAQAKLQEAKDAKKRANEESGAPGAAAAAEEEDVYVYLPPGSSMRDPITLPNSMSDPLDNRKVYYRDPNPANRK